jgi:hypothetical protein
MSVIEIKIGEPLPKNLYFNCVEWVGDIAVINGYNGCESSMDDGYLCAVVNNSAFTRGCANVLTDVDGNLYRAKHLRNQVINLFKGN